MVTIALWPCSTWCEMGELNSYLAWKSDDYCLLEVDFGDDGEPIINAGAVRLPRPADWIDVDTGEQRVTPRPALHKRPPAMARDVAPETHTLLSGIPKKRGRRATGKALSGAERQKRYRKSHKSVETGDRMAFTIRALADQFGLSESEVTRHLLAFALCNKNWARTGFPRVHQSGQLDENPDQ